MAVRLKIYEQLMLNFKGAVQYKAFAKLTGIRTNALIQYDRGEAIMMRSDFVELICNKLELSEPNDIYEFIEAPLPELDPEIAWDWDYFTKTYPHLFEGSKKTKKTDT